jgi:hypothetical protein
MKMKRKSIKIMILLFLGIFIIQAGVMGMKQEPESKTKLHLSIFSGKISGNEAPNEIFEDEISIRNLPAPQQDQALADQIGTIFKNGITDLKLESQGEYREPSNDNLDKINWLANDFLLKFSLENEIPREKALKGKLLLFNLRRKKEYSSDFSLEPGKGLLAAIKNKETVLMVTMQLNEIEEAYNTIYKTDRFTIYSKDESWSDLRLSAEDIVFTGSKAVIPAGDCRIILEGEQIVYSKELNRLTAINGVITDCNGKKTGKKKRIEVPLKQPLKFVAD